MKTRDLWGGLSARELELYLHLLSGSRGDTYGQISRDLSELFGEAYGKGQIGYSIPKLREMGLVQPEGFAPTKEAIDDILDRLSRFYGRAAYDPAIQNIKDLGDDQRYFKVIVNGAEKALDAIGTRRRNLDDLAEVIMNDWMIGTLNSANSSRRLSQEQRKKFKSLLEHSKTSIIQGMSEEDPIYQSALAKTLLGILSKWVQFIGRYTGIPPI